MNKSGSVFLNVLAVVGVFLLIILIVAGVTAYQAYGVIQVATEESAKIQNNSQLLVEQKDCARLKDIEDSILKIESKYSSACKNPVLSFAVKQVESVPVKCETLPNFKKDFEEKFNEAKLYCDSDGKLNESMINGSIKEEELLALAQKYGIKI